MSIITYVRLLVLGNFRAARAARGGGTEHPYRRARLGLLPVGVMLGMNHSIKAVFSVMTGPAAHLPVPTRRCSPAACSVAVTSSGARLFLLPLGIAD